MLKNYRNDRKTREGPRKNTKLQYVLLIMLHNKKKRDTRVVSMGNKIDSRAFVAELTALYQLTFTLFGSGLT